MQSVRLLKQAPIRSVSYRSIRNLLKFCQNYNQQRQPFSQMLIKIAIVALIIHTIDGLVATKIEAQLKFPEYCLYHGYPTETHIIHTQDGYNLKFFRLQAKNSNIQPRDKVVYLQHGLQDTSDTWIVNEEHLAPGFALANRGYDVWVGNTRGNTYSSPALNPRLRNFWNFTIDEMIKYDLPAAFSYIHNVTLKKIHYIGHSQGTMIMFGALSEQNPIIKSLLESYSALGPVAYIQNMESKFLKTTCHPKVLATLDAFGMHEMFFTNDSVHVVLSELCVIDNTMCRITLAEISEMNNTVNNVKRMNVVMGHFPGGSSVKNMDHFAQNYKSHKFCKYDYGAKKNQQIYGTPEPPIYDLSKIDFPVHLFVGEYDKLADIQDATRLYNQLTNSPNKTMRLLKFGHATFIWGNQLTYLEDVVKIIQN